MNQSLLFIFLFFKDLFLIFYFFLPALDHWCCAQALVKMLRFLIAVACELPRTGQLLRTSSRHMRSVVEACGLWRAGSIVMTHGLSCSVACGILPDQRSNPCSLHCQVNS